MWQPANSIRFNALYQQTFNEITSLPYLKAQQIKAAIYLHLSAKNCQFCCYFIHKKDEPFFYMQEIRQDILLFELSKVSSAKK